MKANELRLNNLVYCTLVKDNRTVESLSRSGINTGQELLHIERFEPIPLTEEWLKRFGFENEGGTWSGGELIDIQKNNNGWFALAYARHEVIDVSVYFHNVHQLQNLYYALTGEELELKK